ncbi:Imm52 family immunity protein [Archangium violaceum]|uniref:Immunity protein 52 domain-containing protein n=1 Tax=Archangium violaceum Cb vi76 TaxID=1406225 RepID=A0A084SZG7_9BACT|nr:Imm52 family immunity protein [Archangium violaceum]KFA93852.1 hypothetical protein Q664_06700 [Archangium violaceum Cb vi76]
MAENYYVGAYWGPRRETAQECAGRMERFLHMLARCEPSFAQWYMAGRSFPRGLPGSPVVPEAKELEKLFLKSRSRTAIGKEPVEDLGFSRSMWNAKKDATDIHLTCGKYSPWGGPNVCLLELARTGAVLQRLLLQPPVLAEMLTSMATAWDPDFAVATSSEMVALVERKMGDVRIGWLTYLSRQLGTLPPLPAPVLIEPVGTLGWLLILSPEPMTASNPEHVAFTRRIRDMLDRAGFIQRPAPEPEDPHR